MNGFDLDIPTDRPVLIAGATASGKSALAMKIAAQGGGVIVNADAIQIYANWRVLTARPSAEDEATAPHHLFGHIAYDQPYSAGEWLRELAPLLGGPQRPIIVGGTGLYFAALTDGLAEIPQTPGDIRRKADAMLRDQGLDAMISALDPATRDKIDLQNPMRVQRAWEVKATTGRGLASWHADTPPPLLPLDHCMPILLDAGKDWLNSRIAARFDQMLASGALDEARANLCHWDPALPSAKAIGAPELIAHLHGDLTLDQAREKATIATRQFAKRQRTWFRARMGAWHRLDPAKL
ncbi:tRNA (adenosine(37)-N6)-dimethylallyltransferase MiaA [Roseovarius sp. 2305UL8-3]|uniref:tRNA (adenosine(37)-N6)-dimethylallyltransferase MiaA n=1 Tax=Roseovarius conchicola TaxID=3121636 RepID=UPI00352897AA